MSSIRADQVGGRIVDNTTEVPGTRAPLVLNMTTFGQVTAQVSKVSEAGRAPLAWYVAFAGSLGLLGLLGVCVLYLIFTGVGVWGLNTPVAWAYDITNFVFWVGIGHAGTLISAILFLFRQKWRTSHQPLRGGDDDLRGHVRRHLPRHPRRARLGGCTGSSRSRTRRRCGRTSARRCCGTCSRSAPTSPSRCCSGTRD